MTEVLSVSQLNRQVRELLQKNIPLLWVAGEISNLTRAASGHFYFSLKDDEALVRCVMFRSRAQLLPWKLENGQQIEAQAQVGLYEARGDFQLNIEALRRAGLGRLYEAFARLRAQLEAEGLFAPERKRALPRFPRGIGIVTSPQAAALHDLCTTLRRRAPHLPLILYPAPVQGEGAAEKLAEAIRLAGERAREDRIDLLIVARGGGSIEDLWAFNEVCVARAIAACPLPVLSGIGHETDTSIADLVADQRAATPTAAAELASAGWFEAADKLDHLAEQLRGNLQNLIETRNQRLDLLAHRLLHPGQRITRNRLEQAHLKTRLDATFRTHLHQQNVRLEQLRQKLRARQPEPAREAQRLQLLAQRLRTRLYQLVSHRRAQMETLSATLTSLNPEATLARGYSIIRSEDGSLIRNSRQIHPGANIKLQFSEGSARATIIETTLSEPNT